MLARRAFVKHSLPLIDTAQLNGIKANLGRPTSNARLLHGCSAGFLRRSQDGLLLIGLGPQGDGPVGRIRRLTGNTGQR